MLLFILLDCSLFSYIKNGVQCVKNKTKPKLKLSASIMSLECY